AINEKALKEYANYYEKITRYLPHQREAYVFLGFCYQYLGKIPEAAQAFQQAIQLDPNFFWSYYNLGVILFNKGDYKGASQLFKRALEVDIKQTLQTMSQSYIYLEIMNREVK